MIKEAKLLLHVGVDSLILAIELFNRPSERGRATSTLILLDHSFEMLLKAAILHKGGKIREKKKPNTIGFDACIRKGISDSKIKFLSEEQALSLQVINSLRDAAQHYLLDISEEQLYLHLQAGVTLFSDILACTFNIKLSERLPKRVLPIATIVPKDISALFRFEMKEMKKLLQPGNRKKTEAKARLRPLAILEASFKGEKTTQPSNAELEKIAQKIINGDKWEDIFPSVASLNLTSSGNGTEISLRLTKKEGVPIHLVNGDNPETSVVAIKRVNELGFYNLGLRQMTKKLGITQPKLLALIEKYDIQKNSEYFKLIKIGTQKHKRYSNKALSLIEELIEKNDLDEIWKSYKMNRLRNK